MNQDIVPKHRLALIGCGGMANTHVSRLAPLLNRLAVVAAVDVILERAEAVAKHFPGCKAAADYRMVLDDADCVLLVLPHHLHHPIGMDCLTRGKHVLMEKPLANSEAECLELIEASRKFRCTLMVAYCMRYHPLVIKMKELLDAKTYGECFQVSIWTEQHTQRDPDDWMCRVATLGGGQFFSHGCHYVDILLWYLGRPVRGHHMGTNRGTPWMEKEGTSNVVIEFEGGKLAYHFGTWGARGSKLGYAFHAHCTEGMLELDFASEKLSLRKGREEILLMESPGLKTTREEMGHFLDCIETGARPLTDGPRSLQGLRTIWRMYEAETGDVIADLRGLGFENVDDSGRLLKT